MNYYVVNDKGYYFHVQQDVVLSRLSDCFLFDAKEQMYKHVMSQLNLGHDEVDCGEMVIKNNCCHDPRGIAVRINGRVEDFIVDFVL